MPKYKVKYRDNPTRPTYSTREVEADKVSRGDGQVTFYDGNGVVWQIQEGLVAEVERVDED
ncbi:MAG: hypothetical protein PVG83_01225 [Acidimicrobiia bacterium]|jgi:hypothetical protein